MATRFNAALKSKTLSVCVAFLLVAGCSDKAKNPAAEQKAVASGMPPADGISDGLQKRAGKTDYNLEMIGSVVTPLLKKDLETPATAAIPVVGWAVDSDSKSVAGGVEVVIDGRAYKAKYGDPRPDVAKYLGNPSYTNSGYNYTLPASALAPGAHNVEVRVITADGKGYYPIGPVEFKAN